MACDVSPVAMFLFFVNILRRLFCTATLLVQNANVQSVARKILNKLLCKLQMQSISNIGAFIT